MRVTTDVAKLDALAHELRLTARQRRLADLAAADPGGNQSEMARQAGYTGTPDAVAVTATRTLGLAKVRKYMSALTSEAIQRAQKSTRGAIADKAEAMEFLTSVMRLRPQDYLAEDGTLSMAKLREAPAGVLRKIKVRSTTDAEGQVFAEHEAAFESGSTAAIALLRHYDGEDAPGVGAQVLESLLTVLAGVPSDQLRALRDRARAMRGRDVTPEARRIAG